PGNIPVGEEVIFQRTLTFSELQAKQSYSRKVSRDDQVVESMKAHVLRSESVIAIPLAKTNLHYRGKHARCGRKLWRIKRSSRRINLNGWPTQARFWLEWGSSAAGQSLPASLSRFRAVHSDSICTRPSSPVA